MAQPDPQGSLSKLLEEAGLVNEDMTKAMMQASQEYGVPLKQAFISQGIVSEDDILELVARNQGMELVSLQGLKVTKELLEQIPAKTARLFRVFPVEYSDTTVKVALSDPFNLSVTDDLHRILDKTVIPVVAPEAEIDRYIKKFYEANEVSDMYEHFTEQIYQEAGETTDFSDAYQNIELDPTKAAEEQPAVVRFVDLVFKQAVHDRASDIHVEPQKGEMRIRFRIDGVLHQVPSPPLKWQSAILSRLKVLSGMDLAEKRIPQDGRIKLNIPGKKLDVRVSCLPAIHGETIVMRILDQASVLLGLGDVGFLPDNVKLFEMLIKSPTGIILMTGPTGSGKTTTLYAALGTINTPETKIITVENPVEYQLEGVCQVQVNEEIGLDFAAALRSMLRQSPDVIMVGEIRDLQTAEIAIRAALTGHLVFSTLHTNDAPGAPTRLIDMGIKPFLVASALQAAIAQRLIRRICPYCQTTYVPHPEELLEVGVDAEKFRDREFIKGQGCERCGDSGYRGRTAIHEIMVVNPTIRRMIMEVRSAMQIKKAAVREGMRTLRMDGFEKVLLGQATIPEILRITQGD
ncbi:MAG: type II/IV secretion system protein [Candidatus Sumerlaeia bacterium]|nr:type II/IV secretion system protein [Candidatus Sumerlaeia bacterium]